jgi:hypothetical protein
MLLNILTVSVHVMSVCRLAETSRGSALRVLWGNQMIMSLLTRLRRPKPAITYPDDVRRLSAEMKRQGFVASEQDIAWAYETWSEERWNCSWLPLDTDLVTLQKAVHGIRSYLVVGE